ncbi:MAG: GHMP kinase [Verrucomicrobiae bacterium]|nr:GHMP kinase [Verrucomicrobiae bacterium]
MLIKCTAPIRICDLGGWTDTWFAGTGKVLNIAIFPYVEVLVAARKKKKNEPQITIHAENYGDSYNIQANSKSWSKHPLIEAAFTLFKLPEDLRLEVSIFSEAPAGASTGTSAAVSVALIAALDYISGGNLTSHEIASKAHYVETEILKLQSGIQDQLCSAYGGVNFIEMNRYPEATVSPIYLKEELSWELESRLLLIYLGKPHSSSEVHKTVIQRLEQSPEFRKYLDPLRLSAEEGKKALLKSDLTAFGETMVYNTEAQAKLHSELVGERARMVIEIAKKFKAIGWKVNGAGGSGGSVTLLMDENTRHKHALIQAIEKAHSDFKNIPVRLAPYGLRRWKI